MLLQFLVGFENTRFLDGGGERFDLIASFFSNLDKVGLFGNGFGSYGHIYNGQDVYPHNMPIEMIYEMGAVSFFCFMLLLTPYLKKLFRLVFLGGFSNLGMCEKYFLSVMSFYFVVSNISGDFYYNLIFISLVIMYNYLYSKMG